MSTNRAREMGRRVVAERERLGLSQAKLAEAADIAPNTLGKIEAGRSVHPASLRKVVVALAIDDEPDTGDALPREVQLAQNVVREWLLGMPQEEWPAAMLRLVRAMSQPGSGS